jgi:membrane protein implicated in regulation of membrane protease activity
MEIWWNSINSFEQVFWYIAVPFSVILVIQMILTFSGISGGSSDIGSGVHDGNISSEHHSGDLGQSFQFFTLRNFIAFFTIFGWSGITCINLGLSNILTVIISVVSGFIAMIIISLLFYFITKLAESGNSDIKDAIGKTGKVYIPIKANSTNTGKIQISYGGSLREVNAITKGSEDLTTGTLVKVMDNIGETTLIVEKA